MINFSLVQVELQVGKVLLICPFSFGGISEVSRYILSFMSCLLSFGSVGIPHGEGNEVEC